MSNSFGFFVKGPSGYVSYKVFQESRKGGGGKGPSSNSGCMMTIVLALAAVSFVWALVIC